MAKFGQEDPRWIVKDRDDGKNVNGWHWVEKNYLEWTKKFLNGALVGVHADIGIRDSWARVTKIEECSGDAYITQRKGKKKFSVFDLRIKLEWEGVYVERESNTTSTQLVADQPTESEQEKESKKRGKTVKGMVVVNEFCSTIESDDWEFEIKTDDSSRESAILRDSVIKTMIPRLRERLKDFAKELDAQPI